MSDRPLDSPLTDDFPYRFICFDKYMSSYYHTMSFLSLHNDLIAQYVAFELAVEKY